MAYNYLELIMDLIDIEKSEDREKIIKFSSLKQRLFWAKEGHFLDILHKDNSYLVRKEVAETGSYLEELKVDNAHEVRLAVLKKTSVEFMDFKKLSSENINIIKQVFQLGVCPLSLDYSSNWQIKLELLKARGFSFCKENNLIDKIKDEHIEVQKELLRMGIHFNKSDLKGELATLFIEIKDQASVSELFGNTDDENLLRLAILNNYKINDTSGKRVSKIFEEINFSLKCIEKGLYLELILSLLHKEEEILCAFLRKKYYDIGFYGSNNRKQTVMVIAKDKMSYKKAKIIYDNDLNLFNKLDITEEIKQEVLEKEKNKLIRKTKSKNIITI
jgi:hypothetical protein